MKQRILVTGANGFLGSWITKKLADKSIVALASPFSDTDRLTEVEDNISIVKCDLANEAEVSKVFQNFNPDYVLHLASHGVYQYQQNDTKRIVVDNYLMTANLLEQSAKCGVKKFINTGSVFEYGSRDGVVKEGDVSLDDIINKYSAVKMATTALANSYASEINIITLRPFTVYGPREDKTRFISSTIERAVKNDSIRIVKDVVRDFVYVEDVADAYIKCLEIDLSSGEIVNIASGIKTRLEDASKVIKEITNSQSEIIIDNSYKRSNESRCYADITKAKKLLGWQPKYNLPMGIKKMIYSSI